jgi:hypothetical protein
MIEEKVGEVAYKVLAGELRRAILQRRCADAPTGNTSAISAPSRISGALWGFC